MKIAPIIHSMDKEWGDKKNYNYRLIHTGQHYDHNMSEQFFNQLDIPKPDINLEVGSGTQAAQTAGIMIGYEKVLLKEKSDLCIVVGDVTSTMACAITAQKMHVPVAHVEGGIRSDDWTMPEEINRLLTDSITNWFFTTSEFANKNLVKSGVSRDRIFFVGNTMIDTLLANMQKLKKPDFWDDLKLTPGDYFVMTMHRPSNVDSLERLQKLLYAVAMNVDGHPLVFPVHPRTQKQLDDLDNKITNMHYVAPQGYLEFNYLVKHAKGVITDSGGITEETTVMSVPCLSLRENTERPETVSVGTNELVGHNKKRLFQRCIKLHPGVGKREKYLKNGMAKQRNESYNEFRNLLGKNQTVSEGIISNESYP
ncbi:MAG: UDP-N-acetylglucosamine 2-epimerase (non-hydrolyzing) [Balneolaceae bacterium]|nr:UDP-N-acetylglucosamine 2-epimerase (non-hydrolyzing) [Balneolaceae bacterium]